MESPGTAMRRGPTSWNDLKMKRTTLLWFCRSVVSDSLPPPGRQHARLPCPSPSLERAQTHVHWRWPICAKWWDGSLPGREKTQAGAQAPGEQSGGGAAEVRWETGEGWEQEKPGLPGSSAHSGAFIWREMQDRWMECLLRSEEERSKTGGDGAWTKKGAVDRERSGWIWVPRELSVFDKTTEQKGTGLSNWDGEKWNWNRVPSRVFISHILFFHCLLNTQMGLSRKQLDIQALSSGREKNAGEREELQIFNLSVKSRWWWPFSC